MQYRRYETVINSFSGSSSEYDEGDDEIYYEEYDRQSVFTGREATGSKLFRRWFLNIIDLPNALTNRLKDWLKAPSGSRSSTSDKSSGTSSVQTSEIQLTECTEGDDDGYYKKPKHRRNRDDPSKHFHAPGAHRPLKNHHVYHIYKQNEMEIHRSVGGQRNYSTSWLQRNERFSSSPVLVLPRIDPDTGQPICHPRSYHSRTSTDRRTVTRGNENLKRENWRSGIWELQTNHYTHLRGDTNLIGAFVGKEITEKSQSSLTSKKNRVDKDNGNDDREIDLKSVELNMTASTAFRETISMRLNHEDSQSFAQIPYNAIIDKNNLEKIKIDDAKERNYTEVHDYRKLSTITPSNVEDLLKNLREKMNSLNAEKKFNSPVGRLSSLMKQEIRSYDREHSFPSRWQDKSALFAKGVTSTCAVTRASFTERIQDIWIQEKTSRQLAVPHKRGTVLRDETTSIEDNEDFREEKEINCDNVDTITKIEEKENLQESKEIDCIGTEINEKQNIEGLASLLSSSKDNEISTPRVCHVAVQYSVTEVEASKELHHQLVSPSGNNDDKSEIQIPQNLKSLTVPNEILIDSIQIPAAQEIQTYAQYHIEASGDYVSPPSFIAVESRANREKDYLFDELSAKNKFSFLDDAPKSVASHPLILFPRKKKFGYRFTRLTKISHKPSFRFSRKSFLQTKKLSLPRCRVSKKLRLWLFHKFHSDSTATQLPVDDKTNSESRERIKFGCMANIFKCIKKASKIDVSPRFFEVSSTIIAPIPPIRLKKLRSQSLTNKMTEPLSKDAENSLIEKSKIKCPEEIPVDLTTNTIESETSGNCKTHSERSMTMLSVTTSNSTNITLQLLDSTSDTTIVPSRSSQDDFKRRVVETPDCAEITTRKQEIETFKETTDHRTDLFSPVPILRRDESKLFKFNDILEIPEISESKSNKNSEKKSLKLDGKFSKADVTNEGLRSKENILFNKGQRARVKSEKTIFDKKRSLDIESLPSRKRSLSRVEKMSLSDNNAGARNANNLRLKHRESVIDIGIDKTSCSESKPKSPETRNTSNKLDERKSVLNITGNDRSGTVETKESPEKRQVRGLNSIGFYPELLPTNPRKKLRQRADSPMIPRKVTNTQNRRSTAAGKSSLIPVGIGNSKYLGTVNNSDEKETKHICKSKLPEEKNRSAIKSAQKYRTSLKKTPRDISNSERKKTSNHKVRFELEKISLNEEKSKKIYEKKFENLSENLIDRSLHVDRKIDDKRVVRKIKSSLENGMPFKRITIMDPYSVTNSLSVKYDREAKAKVEKDVIDQASESRANTQNLPTPMEKTRPISRRDKELVDQTYPHRKTLLSKQTPKHGDLFEKRHPDESKLSYRSRALREKNKNHLTDYSSKRERKNFNESIIDLARIKEKVENEILEKTSRTSGTEDSDCANVLIKAINSSMEMSDAL